MSAFFYNNKKSDLNFQGEFSLKKQIKFKSDFFFSKNEFVCKKMQKNIFRKIGHEKKDWKKFQANFDKIKILGQFI